MELSLKIRSLFEKNLAILQQFLFKTEIGKYQRNNVIFEKSRKNILKKTDFCQVLLRYEKIELFTLEKKLIF